MPIEQCSPVSSSTARWSSAASASGIVGVGADGGFVPAPHLDDDREPPQRRPSPRPRPPRTPACPTAGTPRRGSGGPRRAAACPSGRRTHGPRRTRWRRPAAAVSDRRRRRRRPGGRAARDGAAPRRRRGTGRGRRGGSSAPSRSQCAYCFVMTEMRRCRWCRRPLPEQRGRGRPREFCSQRCRQWDWVARQRAGELELSEGELVSPGRRSTSCTISSTCWRARWRTPTPISPSPTAHGRRRAAPHARGCWTRRDRWRPGGRRQFRHDGMGGLVPRDGFGRGASAHCSESVGVVGHEVRRQAIGVFAAGKVATWHSDGRNARRNAHNRRYRRSWSGGSA